MDCWRLAECLAQFKLGWMALLLRNSGHVLALCWFLGLIDEGESNGDALILSAIACAYRVMNQA
ncbi:hypothetical protein [uncultured Deefgea sp.]|uniref:hypothetical protein n=1 Tax=uncultured Deefgea sp. TaxID=1304914 RepID=UPI002592723A|nr:hypothetical protein [uncultured Deefgea sp.]